MTVIAIIAVVTVALGGTGYGVYKYQEMRDENEQIRVELDEQKNKEIARLEEELETAKEQSATDELQDEVVVEEVKEPEPVASRPSTPTPASPPPANTDYYAVTNEPTPVPAVVEKVPEPEIESNVKLLTQSDRDFLTTEAQKVIDYADGALDALDNRMDVIRKSNYREEYLLVEQAIRETEKIYESDKKMAGLIIDAAKNAGDTNYLAVQSAYKVFIESAQETVSDTEFMFASIDSLMKQSQEIIELIIELEVIDELSAQYGVSSGGSSLPPGYSSSVQDARDRADDYIKSLSSKYDDEKEVNNYLIGIVVFY